PSGDAKLEESRGAALSHQPAALGVDIAALLAHILGAPALQLITECAMLRVKERPRKEASVRHQLPSNTGFCLLANASNARLKSFVSIQRAWARASISSA